MITLARLDSLLKANGVPIDGVSRQNGNIVVHPASLQAQAQPIIDAYVEPTPAQLLDEDAQRDVNEKKLQAVALALWECIPAPTMTKVQLKNRAIAIYKNL